MTYSQYSLEHKSSFLWGLVSFFLLGLLIFASPKSFAQDAANVKFMRVYADKENVLTFTPKTAKFLRMSIFSSYGGAPAIDELQIFSSDENSKNLAQESGVVISTSSCIEGFAIHKVEHLVDGHFGNDASWVAADMPSKNAPQWVELRWNEPVEIARVVFSRDKNAVYNDRLPLEIAIDLSDDGCNWTRHSHIYGTTNDIGINTISSAGSRWFNEVPQGARIDVSRYPSELPSLGNSNDYDCHLRDAFLFEENALLKIAGFAYCEPWLIQRHYPEYVEPECKPDSITTLPTIDITSEAITADRGAFWKRVSAASVRAFAPGAFGIGPLLEQTARAAIVGDNLYLRIEGNRFLSENRAMVATENLPTRGFVTVRDNKIYWKQIDAFDGRDTGLETEIQGVLEETTGNVEAVIPLAFLPEAGTRGIYVALGFGGNWLPVGGRPAHFLPADFSISLSNESDVDANFIARIEATGSNDVEIQTSFGAILLHAGKSMEFPVQGVYGQVGPEVVLNAVEKNTKLAVRLVGFQYDSCYRPFCQLKDAFERSEATAEEALDIRDFQKRTAIPGAANPRYVNVKEIVDSLNLPCENKDLARWFSSVSVDGDETSAKSRAVALWKEYRALSNLSGVERHIAERELFWKIRTLKREVFLSNEELESVEHLLANKRHPFHPSHNYSDLFDSTWRPGGAVVLIDIPRENGRLVPEKATTREVVQAGDGVIRNPSASFDATKIYYAHRLNQSEYFRIFELNLETGEKHRISAEGPFHDFWPTELPDGGLAFISTRCKKKFICWRPQAFVLHRMEMDGTNIQPLSFANLTEFAPSVCDDGRLMWTRSEYVDKGADYGHTLWTIRTDGTVPELTFGNTINLPQGYANGRRVPDCDDVSCVLISHFGDLNGPVALLDQAKGPHDPTAIRSITPEVPWPGFWAKTETFREPYPVTRDVFLVAHAAANRFGVYLVDRFGNRELLTIDDSIDTICPQIFAPRDVPPVVKSAFEPNLKEQKLGLFSVANVYRGLEGQVEPGTAKYLRICQEMPAPLQQLPDGTYRTDHNPYEEYYAAPIDVLQGAYGWPSYVAKGVVGTVEIKEDGSVDFLAPAEKVLFFQLLDENFNEIQRMRSVIQLQAGERRSCIGCHESRLSTPEGGLTVASGSEPQTWVEPSWGAGAFWYERIVQPILDKKCTECHTAQTMTDNPRQLDLTGKVDQNKIPASYRSLLKSGDVAYFDYAYWLGKTTKADPYTFGVFQSKLFDVLKDERHKDVKLDLEEERAIKCWIDLNVPLWGDYQYRSERK